MKMKSLNVYFELDINHLNVTMKTILFQEFSYQLDHLAVLKRCWNTNFKASEALWPEHQL